MPSSIRKALNELPVTLDDTYERILQNIPKQKWQHAHRLFQCMVAAIRPFRVEELAELFAIGMGPNAAPNLVEDWRPENPEEAIFSACSTLITIINDQGSKIVQFSHFSVKEYLTSDRLQTSGVPNICQFYVPLEPAHTILVRACLAVLLQLEEKMDEERLSIFPLALYAAQSWIYHAQFENVASQIQDAMEDLFNPIKPHFRIWSWICDYHMLVVNGPDVPPSKPLYFAVLCGFSVLVKQLIVTHAQDVNDKIHSGYTPLHAVSRTGDIDIAGILLDYGADIDTRDVFNQTPLHWAAWMGQVKIVQLFLENGATLNAQSDSNYTPLHEASGSGRLEVVRLLLDHGADVHIRDEDGLTPFQLATREGHHDIAQLLLDRGSQRE